MAAASTGAARRANSHAHAQLHANTYSFMSASDELGEFLKFEVKDPEFLFRQFLEEKLTTDFCGWNATELTILMARWFKNASTVQQQGAAKTIEKMNLFTQRASVSDGVSSSASHAFEKFAEIQERDYQRRTLEQNFPAFHTKIQQYNQAYEAFESMAKGGSASHERKGIWNNLTRNIESRDFLRHYLPEIQLCHAIIEGADKSDTTHAVTMALKRLNDIASASTPEDPVLDANVAALMTYPEHQRPRIANSHLGGLKAKEPLPFDKMSKLLYSVPMKRILPRTTLRFDTHSDLLPFTREVIDEHDEADDDDDEILAFLDATVPSQPLQGGGDPPGVPSSRLPGWTLPSNHEWASLLTGPPHEILKVRHSLQLTREHLFEVATGQYISDKVVDMGLRDICDSTDGCFALSSHVWIAEREFPESGVP
jgi:hypothetical protein